MAEDSANARAVREFFRAYSEGRPELFDEVVAPDYADYGHTPPGVGPQGARDDLAQAQAKVGRVEYEILSLVDDEDGHVAAHWTGRAGGQTFSGLSIYSVRDGLIRSTHHVAEGTPPSG